MISAADAAMLKVAFCDLAEKRTKHRSTLGRRGQIRHMGQDVAAVAKRFSVRVKDAMRAIFGS